MTRIDLMAAERTLGISRGDVLVIAADDTASVAEQAVVASQVALLGRIGWPEAHERLKRQSAVAIVLAEAVGVDDRVLAQVLPLLDELARSGDTRVIATLDVAQIDLMAGSLCSAGAELLCVPTLADRVAALCLASPRGRNRLHDVRERPKRRAFDACTKKLRVSRKRWHG